MIPTKTIVLPKDPLPPATTDARSIILFGAPKIGKTTAVAALPDSFIIDCDPNGGADHTESRRLRATSYQEFMDIVNAVKATRPYRFVIVDTIDGLEDLCRKEATRRYKTANVGANFTGTDICTELPQGAGYLWLRNALNEAMSHVMLSAQHTIFIGHVREKIEPGKEGKDVIVKELDLTGKCAKIACQNVDAIGHMTRRTREKKHPADKSIEDLWVSFKTSESIVCGNRVQHLAGKEILFSSAEERKFKWEEIYRTLNTTQV